MKSWLKTTFWILPLTLGLAACQPRLQQHTTAELAAPALTVPAFTDLTVPEFAEMIGRKRAVLLDVRTPEETAQGKIAGAMEIDVLAADFADRIGSLDKRKTYLVYCRSGRRSVKACEIMAEAGFTKLYNLQGGYNAWSVEK